MPLDVEVEDSFRNFNFEDERTVWLGTTLLTPSEISAYRGIVTECLSEIREAWRDFLAHERKIGNRDSILTPEEEAAQDLTKSIWGHKLPQSPRWVVASDKLQRLQSACAHPVVFCVYDFYVDQKYYDAPEQVWFEVWHCGLCCARVFSTDGQTD